MSNPNGTPENLRPPWPKGYCPNPGGKTKEQRKLEVESAEAAARIRNRMLQSLERSLGEAGEHTDQTVLEAIVGDHLRLMNDAEDRAFGKPTQPNEHTSPDGSMARTVEVVFVGEDDDPPTH